VVGDHEIELESLTT